MSTADEVDSDYDDDDDEDDSDSGSESDDEEDDKAMTLDGASDARRKAKLTKRVRHHPSDTETRNLLDDVGDLDDEILDLEEAKENVVDQRFFDISDEQLEYYTSCFLHLQRRTQGTTNVYGAVSGADEEVVEFFRKSKLDTRTLSKVWALADVNEDGFLNHSEFVIAMHLIVLHVKGRVPLPARLPSPVRPCPTPARQPKPSLHTHPSDLQNSTASSTLSTSNGGGGFSNPENPTHSNSSDSQAHLRASTSTNAATPKQYSQSDDHLHCPPPDTYEVADFSDAPPVLVDNRPQALNAQNSKGLALLNSLASKGPPPLPPSRDYQKDRGHGRSASLDLKTFAAISAFPQGPKPYVPSGVSTSFHSAHPSDLQAAPSSSAFDAHSQSHSMCATSAEVWQARRSNFFPTVDHPHAGSLPTMPSVAAPPPPIPPHLPSRPVIEKLTVETQTDFDDRLSPLVGQQVIDSLLEDAQKLQPAERCELLRRYNADLEMERSTLAQISLQLQLRIEEAHQALKELGIDPQHQFTPQKSTALNAKPTQL